MQTRQLSKRYAQALFESAKAHQALPAVYADYQGVLACFTNGEDLFRRLQSPVLAKDVKKFLFKDRVGNGLHPISKRFFDLLIERKREGLIQEIYQVFQAYHDEHEGRLRAQVTAAAALSPQTEAALQKTLSAYFGKQVILTITRNPALGAGITVEAAGRMIQHNIKSRLSQLKQVLEGSDYRGN